MAPFKVAALAVLAFAALTNADAGADEKNRPVTKVVNLLKDMLKQMEKEGEEDNDIYEKMGCWCTTNEKGKTKAIADATSRITVLQTTIETSTADLARLTAEIANLQSETAKNTNSLAEAGALREKQLAEFNAEEKENLQSLASLKGAVQVLSKTQKGSFLQMSAGESARALAKTMADTKAIDLAAALRQLYRQHQAWFHGSSITPTQGQTLEDFASMLESPDETDTSYSLVDAYHKAPASGAIFGILQQMKDDFETNLANSRAEEEKACADYESLKSTKTQQIADAEQLVETKTGEAADAEEKKATSKEDMETTRASLAADNKFLSDLKVQCVNMDAEFEERTKTRQMEMAACSKALEFLTSDEAHDLFTRTFNPAFMQTAAVSKGRNQLKKLLINTAKTYSDPRLTALAVNMRMDAFAEVKKTIQDMIDGLIKEKNDDVKHKDYCVDEFNSNERDTSNKNREVDQTKANIEDLGMTIDQLDTTIETLKSEVADLQSNQKLMSIERTKANKEFQVTVSDQKATQQLIGTALKVLKSFYDKAALLQEKTESEAAAAAHAAGKQPPPPGFKKAEPSAASGGVMGMMEKIIKEAKGLEEEAMRSEEDAQKEFEEFTRDTTQSIADKSKDTVNKSEDKARAEDERIQAEKERDSQLTQLEELDQTLHDLHKSCDFLLKNWDLRNEARDGETEALKQGLALFSGAAFGAFLQQPRQYD